MQKIDLQSMKADKTHKSLFQTDEQKQYLGSRIEVTNGVNFKIALILPAQHSRDSDDNERYQKDRGQHCSDYPQVIRRVLDHS